MARLYKCYGMCGEKFEIQHMKQIGNKNHCPKCFEVVTKERTDRAELYEYIKYAFNISYPTNYMLKQIKDFIEIRCYKLKGITLTLKYIKEILKLNLNPKFGIAIVATYYEIAKDFYIKQRQRALKHEDIEIKTKTIIVKKTTCKNTYKQSLIIDMGRFL